MSVPSAVRQKLPSVVFCGSEVHKAVVIESVMLRIMYTVVSVSDTAGFHIGTKWLNGFGFTLGPALDSENT